MKFRLALIATASAVAAFAQINPLPTESRYDGIILQTPNGGNQQSLWSSSVLNDYRLDPSNPLAQPLAGQSDAYGRKWTSSAPNRTQVTSNGGTFRVILLGASTDVFSVGYSYLGAPAAQDSYALSFGNGLTAPASFNFGNVADISLLPFDGTTFDLWVNIGSRAYTLFRPVNSLGGAGFSADIVWTENASYVPTYLPALGAAAWVDTWFVSLTERDTDPTTADVSYRLALQQFVPSGGTFEPLVPLAPVPEPSTYGIAGLALLGCLAVRRRMRRG
jgi:hypothetical protein